MFVSVVTVEEYGMLPQEFVYVHQEAGTDSHVSLVPLDKLGTQPVRHVHVQPALTGTELIVRLAQGPESGVSK